MIHPIRAFEDNYIWAIDSEDGPLIVDPGDAAPVLAFLEERKVQPGAIILTHEHFDHVDGVEDLTAKYPFTPVIGPAETADLNTRTVQAGDSFDLAGHHFQVFKTAGHTLDHVTYLVNEKALLTGDALFFAGIGRVFTEDYQLAFDGLQVFKDLPGHLKVYAGHEYSQGNLEWALTEDPDNPAIQEALDRVKALRSDGQPSLPSNLDQERAVNLFLQAEDLATFKRLRNSKDNF